MAEKKNFKRIVRARMAKTGESYTAARAKLNPTDSAPTWLDEGGRALWPHLGAALREGLAHARGEAESGGEQFISPASLLKGLQSVRRDDTARTLVAVLPGSTVGGLASLGDPAHWLSSILTEAVVICRRQGRGRVRPGHVLQAVFATATTAGRGASPFEALTEGARQVLTLAQEEAEGYGHPYIGSEHLLLGCIREGTSRGSRALASLSVELGSVRATLESILGRGASVPSQEKVPTSRVKKIIEMAFALGGQQGVVDVDDIVLAMIGEGGSIAAHVLSDRGVTAFVYQAALAKA